MPAPKVDPKKYDDHMNRNKKPKKMTSTQKSLANISKRANENYDKEPPSPDEKSMAMRQAKFIGYVAEEIMEHVEGDNDFPEWMQNKLSEFHQKAKDMHSTMAGEYEDDEEEMDENYKSEYQRHSQGLKDAQADMKAAKTNDQMVKAMNKKQFHAKAIQRMNRMESFACCGQCNCDPCTCEQITEKLSVGDGMGAWIDDFKKSDAPQFKGKDDKQRRDMAIAAYLSAKRGAKNEAKKVVITKKMQQRALSKVRAQPKDKVSLPKAPWDKNKKEGYVSAAQRKAVWATRADGGKGHPDNKGKK